jgi:myo-inositol-1(or 4)-monophosphatase
MGNEMHCEIDIQSILQSIRSVGNVFLDNFMKAEIPKDRNGFSIAFDEIEQICLSSLKASLGGRFPEIPWAEGELDFRQQESPLPIPEYWLCDSVDGVVQYLQHLPGWTINLVLVRDGHPNFAAIYDPLQGELYWAKEGSGAYLNDTPLKPAWKTETRLMLAAFAHPPLSGKILGLHRRIGVSVEALLDYFGAVRNYGPNALQIASVGAGRIDVFCQEGLDTYNWLPGILIAKEAGAQISTTDGRPWTWGEGSLFVAAPGVLDRFLKRSML